MKTFVTIAVCCAQAIAAICCFVVFPKLFFVASCLFIKFRDRIEAKVSGKTKSFSHSIRFPSSATIQKSNSKFVVVCTVSKETAFTSEDIQSSRTFCELLLQTKTEIDLFCGAPTTFHITDGETATLLFSISK